MTAGSDCDPVIQRALTFADVTLTDATIDFAGGSYTQNGTLNLRASYTYSDACLAAQGFGTASADTCTAVESRPLLNNMIPVCAFESGACVCRGSTDTSFTQSGQYRVDGTQILFDNGFQTGPYCVRNSRAILTSSANGVGPETRYSLRRRP